MRVHLHGLLEARGGAAAVARMLEAGLGTNGVAVSRSFEVADGGGSAGAPCGPESLNAAAPEDALVHVHGSADFAACLSGLEERKGQVLVTLHDCKLFTAGCAYPMDCQGWRESCVSCPRGFDHRQGKVKAVKEALERLDPLLVAPSRWMAELAAQALPGSRVRVLPNGVHWPGALPDKRAAKRAAGLDPEARCVMFAAHGGAQAAYKAGDKWLDIWNGLKRSVPGVVGFAAGGERLERRGDLLVWPYLEADDLRGLMRAADILAYPARADNHPLIILEAMSEGTAALAFDAGGIPEQISDGRTGFLAPGGDWRVFSQRLEERMRKPMRSRRVGREAFESGKARFSSGRMVRDHLRLYGMLQDTRVLAAS
jgi:glycosyltransferase involved in cell wall biosynthesis